jgi:hypothetical protein
MKFHLSRVQWSEGRDEFEHTLDSVPEQWRYRVTRGVVSRSDSFVEYGAYVELHNLDELAEFGDDVDYSLVCDFHPGGDHSDGSITIYDGYME